MAKQFLFFVDDIECGLYSNHDETQEDEDETLAQSWAPQMGTRLLYL